MPSPFATVEPNERYPSPWPRNRDMRETPLQCVRVYASSAPAQGIDSTSSHATLASRPKTEKSVTRINNCKSESPQKVLPSIEHSPKKYLESGIEYSTRKYKVGAGKLVEHSALDSNITTNNLSSNRSTSISAHGLDSDMAKGRDDDWVPSSKEARDTTHSSRSVSSPNPEKYNHVLPTADPDRGGAHWEVMDLEASPSPSSNPTAAMQPVKYELDDGQDLLGGASPPTWNSDLRCWKLEEEGIVEIPKVIMEHEMTLRQLAAQLKVMQAKEREEKGKKREREANGRIECATINNKKRKATDGDETIKLGKTPKNEHEETHDSGVYVRSSLGNDELAMQPSDQVVAIRTDEGLPHCNSAPKHPWQSGQRRHLTEYERFRMPRSCRKQCTCQLMPAYFTQTTHFVPSLATWRGSKLEFLEHVKQLSSCSGHPLSVRDACRGILEKENYPDRLGPPIAMSFAEKWPTFTTTASRSQGLQLLSNPKTSNVSTPNRRLYNSSGLGVRTRVHKNPDRLSSPNTLPLRPNAIISRVSSVISTGSVPSALESRSGTSANDGQTPPPSSPLTNRPRDAGVDSGQQVHHETPDDDSQGVHVQSLETAAAVPPNRLPRTPFSVQRKRHQSMPATFSSRRHTRSPQAQEQTIQGATERLLANDTVPGSETLLYGFSAILNQLKKVADAFNHTSNDQSNRTQPAGISPPPPLPSPPPPPPPAGAAATAEGGQPTRRRSKTVAQRQAGGEPQLARNVPHHLRESDEMLLEIGKKINGYQRHKLAPYAFSYRGSLYKEYIRLLTARDQQGNGVWDCEVMSRVRP